MKILIFAHSSQNGGAENALRYLTKELCLLHTVHVVLPDAVGEEADFFRGLGCQVFGLAVNPVLPNFSTAALMLSKIDFFSISERLRSFEYDLCISNTISIIHGGIISHLLKLPHIVYCHEFLPDNDLSPSDISDSFFYDVLQDSASGVFCCSNFSAGKFRSEKLLPVPVVYPYDFSLPALERPNYQDEGLTLQVIGTQSLRKNAHFALTVCQALRLRGVEAKLDIIGSRNSGTNKLQKLAKKRNVNCRFFDHQSDPYSINEGSRVITLVCSLSEPFGLTIPESLRRGVPVISSNSGGPSELLHSDYIFTPDNLNGCVRAIERVNNDYHFHVEQAYEAYRSLSNSTLTQSATPKVFAEHLSEIKTLPPAGCNLIMAILSAVGHVTTPEINLEIITTSISEVLSRRGIQSSASEVANAIEHERRNPGDAVRADLRLFDVVPFELSAEMDQLYKNGVGLATELAATFGDSGRLQMASFIMCALEERRVTRGPLNRILALGDGLGVDTLRFALAGHKLDYMDYDKSAMAEIAAMNFSLLNKSRSGNLDIHVINEVKDTYDCVFCLEVIEHVGDPSEFLKYISSMMNPGGSLFISECFNGIADVWPTHLVDNELVSGALPLLAGNFFEMTSYNRAPFGKPYHLRKVTDQKGQGLLMQDRRLIRYFMENQADVGV